MLDRSSSRRGGEFLEGRTDFHGMDEGRRHDDSLVLNSARRNALLSMHISRTAGSPRFVCINTIQRGEISFLGPDQ